jgi:DEAD/DEAH box helicase domain-containing protein
MVMADIVYFDLETQKSADEVGGWSNIRDMKMSLGVT